MMKIRSRYSERHPVVLHTGSESYVQQQFKDDCDIHVIVNKFRQGLPVHVMEQPPQYGDFSDVKDFQQAQNLIARTTEFFESLPSDLRARFANSPAEFLTFINNPENEAEAIELGLLQKTPVKPVVDSDTVSGTDPLTPSHETSTPVSEVEKVAP